MSRYRKPRSEAMTAEYLRTRVSIWANRLLVFGAADGAALGTRPWIAPASSIPPATYCW